MGVERDWTCNRPSYWPRILLLLLLLRYRTSIAPSLNFVFTIYPTRHHRPFVTVDTASTTDLILIAMLSGPLTG